MDRNARKREEVKIKEEQKKKEQSAYHIRMRATYLNAFTFHKITGNYHATRAMAILDQVESKQFGMWNGILYTKDCLQAEYLLAKHAAIKAFASAQVASIELEKLGITTQEIAEHFKKFMDSKIFRDDKNYSDFIDEADDMTAHFVDENAQR